MPDSVAKYLNKEGLETYNESIPRTSDEIEQYVYAWLDTHPEATTTVEDGSITDSKLVQTGGILSRTNVYERNASNYDFGWIHGSVAPAGELDSQKGRIHSYVLAAYAGDYFLLNDSTLRFAVHEYDANGYVGNVVGWSNVFEVDHKGHYLIILRKNSNAIISDAEIAELGSKFTWVSSGAYIDDRFENSYKQNMIIAPFVWANRYFDFATGTFNNGNIAGVGATIAPRKMIISVDTGCYISIGIFNDINVNLETLVTSTGWITGPYVIEKDSIFTINFRKGPYGTYTSPVAASNNLHITYIDEDNETSNDYVLNASFIKQPVVTSLLGTLSNPQSFCVYNGKYYSTEGTKLTVQNAAFEVEQEVSLDLGHGNSLQLGHNGLAYASGWNNNLVYVVNLETLAVVDTITIPHIGSTETDYTTVAIDDINRIAYVFQRDTYPSTKTQYNFVVFDYANNNIVSTRKIKEYAAMQACDYYEGKILVAYGLGTTEAPSGLFVCNTVGDILAEYKLGIFATVETEGVCIDRDTKQLLISLLNKRLYAIN